MATYTDPAADAAARLAEFQSGITSGVTPPSSEVQSLSTTPAEVNLANAPNLEKLSALANQINQQAQKQANLSRIPGAAALEEQSSKNIADLLAGNLPQSFTENLRTSLATQYGGAGFGVDTQALNAAALRATGIETQAQKLRGEEALAGAYARNPAAPIWDVTRGMLTPELYTTYLNQKAQQAAEAARLAEQRRQFDISSQWEREQASSQAATQLQIAQMQAGQARAELEEKIREFNRTQDAGVAMQVAQLREQANQAQIQAQLAQQQLNAQIWGTSLQYMEPQFASAEAMFTKTLPQYVTTSMAPGSNVIQIPKFVAPQIRSLGGW